MAGRLSIHDHYKMNSLVLKMSVINLKICILMLLLNPNVFEEVKEKKGSNANYEKITTPRAF